MDRIWKADTVINNWRDKPIRAQVVADPFSDDEGQVVSVGELTIMDAILIVVNTYQCKSMEDAEKKRHVKKALLEAGRGGKISIDTSDYNWLKEVTKAMAPALWQDNAEMVLDVIAEGYIKENPKEKKSDE